MKNGIKIMKHNEKFAHGIIHSLSYKRETWLTYDGVSYPCT